MAISARFQADFSSFLDAVDKAQVKLVDLSKGASAVEGSLNRMVDNFSGRKLIQEAALMTIAVEKAGGISVLTARQLETVGAKAAEAAEKMAKLGYDVAPGLQKIIDATHGASEATGGWLPLLREMGSSWVARIAEGVLLRDVIRGVIEKVKEMAFALPELALKGAAVADVEESFKRLTSQAGLLGGALLTTLRQGTRETVTNFELMKSVNQDLAAGMTLTNQQFGTLASGAFALAKATGTDVKTAFDTMNDAMLTGRTRALALLTGKIDLTDAERKFAQSLLSTADHLTAEGKLEGARVAILHAVGAATQRLGEQTDSLDERVAQGRVAWENFTLELGKTIATSRVLMAGMDGVKAILTATFGGVQQQLIQAITTKIDGALIAVVGFAQGGVQAAGAIIKEWYAVEKVFGNLAQVLDGVRLSFLYANLEAAKLKAWTDPAPQIKADIASIDATIGALLITMTRRGAALQEDDRQQATVDKTTAGYVATLEGLRAKMVSAREGATGLVGPIQELGGASERASEAARRHSFLLTQTSEEAKKAAAAYAALTASNVALSDSDYIIALNLKARGLSEEQIALLIRAKVVQIRMAIEAEKDAVALSTLVTAVQLDGVKKSNDEWARWTETVSKSAAVAGKAIIDGAALIRDVQLKLADFTNQQTLSTTDYQVAKIWEVARQQEATFKGTLQQRAAFNVQIRALAEAQTAALYVDNKALLDDASVTLRQLADRHWTTYLAMRAAPDQYAATTIEKFRQIAKAAEDAAEGISHPFEQAFTRLAAAIPGLIQSALTGGGGLAGAGKAIGSLVGQELGKGVVGSMTEIAPEFMGTALGKMFGAAIPLVGALAGPLIGKILSVFSVGQDEKNARIEVDTYEKSLMATLTAQQKVDAQGRQWAATNLAVGAAYLAVGRSTAEAQAAVDRLTAASHQSAAAAKEAEAAINAVFAEQAADVADLNAAVTKYGFTLAELGPTMKKQQLDEQAKMLLNDWRLLVGSGIDLIAVDQRMASSMQDYLTKAKQTGVEVPAAMKPILQSMLDQGLLVDANGDRLTDLTALGVTFSDTMTAGFDRVVAKLQQLLEGLGLVPKKIAEIPTSVDIQLNGHWNMPDLPRMDDASYASDGGVVTANGVQYLGRGGNVLRFMPRGSDTVPAMLTPGERVLSVSDAKAYAAGQGGPSASDAKVDALLSELADLRRGLPRAIRDAVLLAS